VIFGQFSDITQIVPNLHKRTFGPAIPYAQVLFAGLRLKVNYDLKRYGLYGVILVNF